MITHAAATPASADPVAGAAIPETVARLRETFAAGRTRDLGWRRTQLRAIEAMMAENEGKIADALEADLGRKPFEAWLADTVTTATEARYAAKHVKRGPAAAIACWSAHSCPAAAGWSTSPTARC